jgi:FAS-associated factor 2
MEREQRELERRLRQEQDNAYKSSLLADQEKERKANQEKLERERIERQKLDKERLRHEYLQYLVGIFPEQDNTFGDEKVTKISFRLTNGERVIRKFSGSDSLRVLYEFVEVYPYLNTLEPLDQPPENYTHEFKFSIHSPFPRTVYQPDSETKLADVKGLWPSATLIVDTEEEEEE